MLIHFTVVGFIKNNILLFKATSETVITEEVTIHHQQTSQLSMQFLLKNEQNKFLNLNVALSEVIL